MSHLDNFFKRSLIIMAEDSEYDESLALGATGAFSSRSIEWIPNPNF